MKIRWYGQSCFRISIRKKERKRRTTNVIIDPFGKKCGLDLPSTLKGDILIISRDHPDHNNKSAIKGRRKKEKPFLINKPGEYEVKNIFIEGIREENDPEKTIFAIEGEGFRICHLSAFGGKELNNKTIERIGNIDILLVPVGDEDSLNAKEATGIINEIDPKMVIPMYYKVPKLKRELDKVDDFLKKMGAGDTKPQEKYKVKKKDLSEDETEIIVLKP